MGYHNKLCEIEKHRLEKLGFKVYLEFKIGKTIVDIFAVKEDKVLIVECGWLTTLKKIRIYTEGIKVLHIPSLKCFLPTTPYNPDIEEPSKPLYERYLKKLR